MKLRIGFAGLSALLLGSTAWAHHSYAMFDRDHEIVIAGTVTTWRWGNPHALLVLAVPGAQGDPVTWTLEGSSAEVLRNRGWTRDLIKVGDKVTVHLSPLRDGSDGGQIMSLVTADGQSHIAEVVRK